MKTKRAPSGLRASAPSAIHQPEFPVACLEFPLLFAATFLCGAGNLAAQTAAWTELTHPTSPAFAHHDMTYDSLRHRLIVAGRIRIMENPFAVYAGAADGSWTQLPSPAPAVPGNSDIELAYDSHRDVVVLYTTATNTVWEFNGTNWSVITAASAPIQCRDGAQMQYDPLRHKTVLVGANGWPGQSAASETWLWDGTNWTLAADRSASPRGAAGGGMAFDAARGEMVLLTMYSMQTWTFDGTKWTQRNPATVPSPGLWVFDLAYDPVNQVAVFFCGETTDGHATYPRETWAWNGSDWQKLSPATVPPPTIDYALAYFPERGGLVMHGGWGDPDWRFRTNVWLLTLQGQQTLPGLVSWWRAEGDASDAQGAHHGVTEGGLAFGPGQVGQAFSLNGADASVRLGSWFNLQQFTWSLWVKPGATQVTWADLLDNNHNLSRSWVIQYQNWTDGGRGIWQWGPCDRGTNNFDLQIGVWQHLAVTRDTNNVSSLFLNGQLLATRAGTTTIAYDGTESLHLGRHSTLGRYFNGQIDELMCFDRPLGPAEVASLYLSQGGRPQLSVRYQAGAVVVSWPAAAEGWLLHATANLVPAGNLWTEVPPPYTAAGPTLQFSDSALLGQKFYRLHKP
jgi:hypothetical protein